MYKNHAVAALRYAAERYHVTEDGRLIGPAGNELPLNLDKKGYPHLSIRARRLGITQKVRVHRVVAFHKFGEAVLADGVVVRHRNCNKSDIRPSNILLGSPKDNVDDNTAEIRDRMLAAARAAAKSRRRFTDQEAEEIRALNVAGVGYRKLAVQFKCAKSTIYGIVTNKLYSTEAQADRRLHRA